MPLFTTAPPKIVARQSDAQLAQKITEDQLLFSDDDDELMIDDEELTEGDDVNESGQ